MGTVSKEGKDIEGAEYDVIFNARTESLRRIKRLVGERNVGKVWGIPKFYSPFRVLKAVKNSARIKGQMFYKITNYIYLLTPVPKPITLMFSGKERIVSPL
jgi:hypothetical protein